MFMLQEFEFEVIHWLGCQHVVMDNLSCLDSREAPIRVVDNFLDAALFMVNLVEPLDENELTFIIPWTWYEELFHFLNTATMPNRLYHD